MHEELERGKIGKEEG
jgi:hypothetical protein